MANESEHSDYGTTDGIVPGTMDWHISVVTFRFEDGSQCAGLSVFFEDGSSAYGFAPYETVGDLVFEILLMKGVVNNDAKTSIPAWVRASLSETQQVPLDPTGD